VTATNQQHYYYGSWLERRQPRPLEAATAADHKQPLEAATAANHCLWTVGWSSDSRDHQSKEVGKSYQLTGKLACCLAR